MTVSRDYTLRSTETADFDFICKLHHATLRDYVEPIWGWEESVQNQMVRAAFKPETTQIIEVENQSAGCVSIVRKSREIFLSQLWIMPEYQNQGIGTSIINNIIKVAAPLQVTLHVLKTNPSIRLYERLGFVIYKKEPNGYYLKHGKQS